MLDLETLWQAPVPILVYKGEGEFHNRQGEQIDDDSSVMDWLFQDNGESYYLTWWQNGWVVQFQESFLTPEGFQHKNDIKSFDHSHHGSAEGWKHVFQTRAQAIQEFQDNYRRLRDITKRTCHYEFKEGQCCRNVCDDKNGDVCPKYY